MSVNPTCIFAEYSGEVVDRTGTLGLLDHLQQNAAQRQTVFLEQRQEQRLCTWLKHTLCKIRNFEMLKFCVNAIS